MDPDRLARLTEQQRTCLRYVYSHMTSKEIAPLLGIEPGSVDQHIKAAMRVLGVGDRRSAAKLLAEHEGPRPFRPLVYQSPDVATAPEPVTFAPSSESGRQQYERSSGPALREEQAAFEAPTPFPAPMLPLPIGGARPHDVRWLTRLAWIAGITIGGALAFGALVSGVEALVRLYAS
ncbi:MAG TPA: helix-turn-helix transcriptional regulator [Allosphingosinicella sp.]|nr:helix-turn-helix transcriptional regulator [Allosphingosinicella sp.]